MTTPLPSPTLGEFVGAGAMAFAVTAGLAAWPPSIRPAPPPLVSSTHIDPLGVIAFVPTLLLLVGIVAWQRGYLPSLYRRPEGRCDWCDYNLRGIWSAHCPECGREVP